MDDDLMLQRWLSRRDGWMSVMPLDASQAEAVQDAAAKLAGSGGGVAWRIVRQYPPHTVLAIYDGKRWQAVAEDQLAPELTTPPMPWWQPAADFALRLRERGESRWVDTMPTSKKQD